LKGFILISIAVLGIFFVWLLASFDPAESSFFLTCPFRSITGFPCPGCGSQRALHDLLHGQVGDAFQHNPLVVLGLQYVLIGGVLEYSSLGNRYSAFRQKWTGRFAIYSWGIAIGVFWLARLLCSSCW
jgi:hypothetical protein